MHLTQLSARHRDTPSGTSCREAWLSLCSVLFLFVACCVLCCVPARAADEPNIVLVMADDQGWGEMAYNGHAVLKTPHFDKAAAAGLRFDRFYAAAPVCSPTRASVLTGRHPNRMGVFKWGYPMRPQEVTIAETLKNAGYSTAHFGKWHLGSVRKDSPVNPGKNGFDSWLSAPNFFDNDPILSREGTAVQMKGESSMVVVDAAVDWIGKRTQEDAPFFAVVWFGSPHVPHRAFEQDRQLYDDQPQSSQHFLGEITGMDRAFGKLRDSLSEMGVRENTILWYCSDNGALPKVGDTGGHRGHKGMLYEGGLLVPSILEWPAKIPLPAISQARCNTCDIYPTLLEITGAKAPHQPALDGISLLPIIEGRETGRSTAMGFWDYAINGIKTPSDQWMKALLEAQQDGGDLPPNESSQRAAELPNPLIASHGFPGHSAIIDGDWKLHRIQAKNESVRWELYDLQKDRKETTNLAEEQRGVVESLQPKLKSWLESVVMSIHGNDYAKE